LLSKMEYSEHILTIHLILLMYLDLFLSSSLLLKVNNHINLKILYEIILSDHSIDLKSFSNLLFMINPNQNNVKFLI
jgi:hypothetical protein